MGYKLIISGFTLVIVFGAMLAYGWLNLIHLGAAIMVVGVTLLWFDK